MPHHRVASFFAHNKGDHKMPWTVADVDKHKKGLTDKQKEQWVKVANDALKACQAKGGKDCDASAIRQASSFTCRTIT